MAIVDNKKVLHFSRVAWEKMWGMTLRAKGEVSGFGLIDEHDPCRVVDFHVVKQRVSGSSTIMDPSALDDLFMNSRDKGIALDRWRVWWHSHAEMKAFFSGTDDTTVQRYASEKPLWSVVTNHADARRVAAGHSPTEMYIRIDGFDPDNPKSQTSPSRYTIEGCGWSVGNLQVVPDSWFDEHMGLLEPSFPQTLHPTRQRRSPYKQYGDGSRYRQVGLPSRIPEQLGSYADWGDEDYPGRDLEGRMLLSGRTPAAPPKKEPPVVTEQPDSPVAAIDNDVPLSHPFIEGMYLHGLLQASDAIEISNEFAAGLVEEAELVRHLDVELDKWAKKDPGRWSPDVQAQIRKGDYWGPIDTEVQSA